MNPIVACLVLKFCASVGEHKRVILFTTYTYLSDV